MYLPVIIPVLSAKAHIAAATPSLYWMKAGFICFAVIVVLVLAFFNGGSSGKLRRNKSKNNRPSRSTSNELGSGDLAKKSQIQYWLEKHGKFDTLLPVKLIKGGDGIALKQGNLVIPIEERNRHLLVIAKTGSGKTTRAILPVLYNDCLCPERSTIVLDSKPEMWDKLVGMTRKYNPKKRIILFNPLDIERSLSWNILSKIQTDTDAKLIANTIISATDNPAAKSDSPFFRNNALQLLNSVMVGLLTNPQERLSMPRVHQLLNGGMEPLCKWLEAHPAAIRNSKTFVDLARSGSQNADTIMSELSMRLAAWDLSSIRATTALDELDLESLIAEPTLFIIELRESELEMLRPMANVIIVEVLRYLTKRAENCPGQTLPRPISIVIDEFASALGRLPDIHVKLNTLRSRNVSILAAVQSIAQIKANYERDADSVLAGFSAKILMPTLDFQDAEWASKESGTMTVRFNVNSIGKNKRIIDYFATKNDNIQEQVQQRPVLTPDEIGRPADNAATFFLPNTPVFQGHLVPYFELPEMNAKFLAGKGVDFRLRETAIEYKEILPEAITASDRPTSEQVLAALGETKKALRWDEADAVSRQWWSSMEKMNESNPAAILNLAEQLFKRGVSIGEFYRIYATSGVDNIEALIKLIDQHVISQLKISLSWEAASQHAKEWWIAFEHANGENTLVVIELMQELLKRKVTIDDFFSAYVHSDCNSVPELLKVLDVLIEEKQAEQKAREQVSKMNPPSQQVERAKVDQAAVDQGVVDSFVVDNFVANPAVEAQSQVQPSSRELKEQAVGTVQVKSVQVKSVHVKSYFEMGEELLSRGKTRDFEKLLSLAKEDMQFPEEFLGQLEELRQKA